MPLTSLDLVSIAANIKKMPTTANTTARATKPKLPSADYGALLALEFEPSLELGLATFDRDPDGSGDNA
jgi:hypothetical protein